MQICKKKKSNINKKGNIKKYYVNNLVNLRHQPKLFYFQVNILPY